MQIAARPDRGGVVQRAAHRPGVDEELAAAAVERERTCRHCRVLPLQPVRRASFVVANDARGDGAQTSHGGAASGLRSIFGLCR